MFCLSQVTDALYISLGYVLTISGRTIKPEAQASPGPAQDAKKAIDDLLAKVRNLCIAYPRMRISMTRHG